MKDEIFRFMALLYFILTIRSFSFRFPYSIIFFLNRYRTEATVGWVKTIF